MNNLDWKRRLSVARSRYFDFNWGISEMRSRYSYFDRRISKKRSRYFDFSWGIPEIWSRHFDFSKGILEMRSRQKIFSDRLFIQRSRGEIFSTPIVARISNGGAFSRGIHQPSASRWKSGKQMKIAAMTSSIFRRTLLSTYLRQSFSVDKFPWTLTPSAVFISKFATILINHLLII